jgi:hypothetical protein
MTESEKPTLGKNPTQEEVDRYNKGKGPDYEKDQKEREDAEKYWDDYFSRIGHHPDCLP